VITRRRFVRDGILGYLTVTASPMINLGRVSLFADEIVRVSTRAADLVLGTTVIDMLGLLTLDWAKMFRWHRRTGSFEPDDHRALELSGVNVFHPAVEPGERDPVGAVRAWMKGWNHLLGTNVCRLERVETVSDLTRIPRTGRIGVIVGFQNSGHFLRTSDVAASFAAGQRVSQLTYNGRNRIGSGCYESRDRGLTTFGGEIVSAMDEAGMAIDVSHCGERTSLDAIEASHRPVLVTHSNCRSVNATRHPRCKSDEVIRRMAAKGGVMGITVVRAFVGPSPTLSSLLDHFTHVARIAGIEHVGLGSDVDTHGIDPRSGRPMAFYAIRGLNIHARVFQIADGLLQRGFTPGDVELVLGGNFTRALKEIWPPETDTGVRTRAWQRDPFCPQSKPDVADAVGLTESAPGREGVVPAGRSYSGQ
jgi:membrane dipeptidase